MLRTNPRKRDTMQGSILLGYWGTANGLVFFLVGTPSSYIRRSTPQKKGYFPFLTPPNPEGSIPSKDNRT